MVESTTYQAQRQQLLLTGATVFSAIVAAVIVSTIVVSQIIQGQLASALSSQVTAGAPTTMVAGTCVDTSASAASRADTSVEASATDADTAAWTGARPYSLAALGASGVKDSFNSNTTVNNNTTTTTNNNETNTTDITTTISDSFNRDSYNDNRELNVSVDGNTLNLNSGNTNQQSWTNNQAWNTTTNTSVVTNTDNSNNSVNNSGNTATATNNTTTNTTNVVNSGNTANLLSGNTVPVVVLP